VLKERSVDEDREDRRGRLDSAAAESEQLVMEEFINQADESGLTWATRSPEEISALLEEARAAVAGA